MPLWLKHLSNLIDGTPCHKTFVVVEAAAAEPSHILTDANYGIMIDIDGERKPVIHVV